MPVARSFALIETKASITFATPPDFSYRADAVARVLAGSFRMFRGELEHVEWMTNLARMTQADGATCMSWQPGVTDRFNKITCGAEPQLPTGLLAWIDAALGAHTITEPHLINDELAVTFAGPNAGIACNVDHQRLLLVLVDTAPARTLFCLSRDPGSAAWSDADRHEFRAFAEHIRESCLLHKHIDGLKNIGLISNAVFNSSPRGMLLLTPDGAVAIANARAEQLTTRGDGISIRESRLHIADQEVMSELAAVLRTLDELPRDTLHERRWFWSVAGADRDIPYQLALHVIPLPDFHVESSRSDRVALLFVNDPLNIGRPSSEEMRKFYGFTPAQARLALALWGGMGIKDAASELSISINTARSHLRSIYANTGTRSHAELMSVLTATMVRNEFGPDASVPGRPVNSGWTPTHPAREKL